MLILIILFLGILMNAFFGTALLTKSNINNGRKASEGMDEIIFVLNFVPYITFIMGIIQYTSSKNNKNRL